jgi:hypothetical protein
MRVMAADERGAGESFGDVFLAADPAIAAVTSISPADACALAANLSLRYAVQCWNDQESGKAIFWKPAIAMQGLYRTEFQDRSGRAPLEPHGLLRVTFLWDGRPLNILCADMSAAAEQADWEMVQVARELAAAAGPSILAIGRATAQAPSWPGFVDAWSAARWRWIAYPSTFDIGDATRASFGVAAATSGAINDPAASMRGGPARLYCSDDFAVLGATYRPRLGSRIADGPLTADLAPVANGGPLDGEDDGARRASPREAVG